MTLLANIRSWWKSLRRKARADGEIDEELQFHIETYAADLQRDGRSAKDALEQARREFGAVALHKEDCRHSLGLRILDELRADARYGLRMLLRDRALTVVAVLSLALGIGVNIALFSFSKAVLFDSLSVTDPEQLRLLSWEYPGKSQPVAFLWGEVAVRSDGNFGSSSFSYAVYQKLAAKTELFTGLAAFNMVHQMPAAIDSSAEMVSAQLVSGNFFSVLGVKASLGRNLTPSDMRSDAPAVAMVSHNFWVRRFGSSTAAVGRTIRVNSVPVTVVGVSPSRFGGPQRDVIPDLMMPLSMQPKVDPAFDGDQLQNKNSWWLQLLGRKQSAMPDAKLQAALNVVLDQAVQDTLARSKQDQPKRFQLHVQSGSRGNDRLGERFARPAYMLWALAGLVLLLACSNVANLLLARAGMREREMAVRLALGAGRGRIMRQMFVESGLLAALAGGTGVVVAYIVLQSLPAVLKGLPAAAFDWPVGVFAGLVAAATALVFGLAPALQAARPRIESGDSSRVTAGVSKISSRRLLVILQVALSSILLVACGLFSQTWLNLSKQGVGVETDHLLLFNLLLPEKRYPPVARIAAQREIMDRIAALPGVRSTSVARDALAASSEFTFDFVREGQAQDSAIKAQSNIIDIRFFDAAGIPMLRGRSFTERDTESSQKVAVINSRLAQRVYAGQDPLGKIFNGDRMIVGVVGDTTLGSLRQGVLPAVYLPFTQLKFWGGMTFYVRTSQPPGTALATIRNVVHGFDRDLPVMNMRTQSEQLLDSLAQERLFAALTSFFALLSLLLGSIGVYGVTQFNVVRRTNEIGIRMALGAQQRTVVASVLREGFILVCAGLVLGLVSALALTKLIASFLYGVGGSDLATLAGVVAVLGATTLVAVWQPARRAAKVSPLQALRHE